MPPQLSLLIPVISVIVGILASQAGADAITALIFLLTAVAIFICIGITGKSPRRALAAAKFHNIWIALIFIAAGIFASDFQRPYDETAQPLFPDGYLAVASVAESKTVENGQRIYADIASVVSPQGAEATTTPQFKVIIYSPAADIQRGDMIVFPAKFYPIEESKNYINRNYTLSLKRKGFRHYSRITDLSEIEISRNEGHESLGNLALDIRDKIEIYIEKLPLATSTKHFIITILLGDKDYSDEDVRKSFSEAGIAHILALSGMHTAIIAGIFLWLLFPLNFIGKYKWRLAISLLFLWIYTFISGLSPSTLRAALMLTFIFAGVILERKSSSLNALAAALIIILLSSPNALFDIGLQLSALCVAALILFVNPLNTADQHESPRLYKFNSFLLTAMAATGATWTLTSYHFGIVPLLFIPANLIAIPFINIFIVASLAFILLSSVVPGLHFIGRALDFALSMFQGVIDRLAENGASSLSYSATLPVMISWLLAVAVFAWYLNVKRNNRTLTLSVSAFAATVILILFQPQETVSDGFIIQNRLDRLQIASYLSGKEEIITPPVGTTSLIQIAGSNIVTADNLLMSSMSERKLPPHTDILVISKGFTGDLSSLPEDIEVGLIVFHPSIFKKREKALSLQADSLSIPVYSIRESGPFSLFRQK